MHSRFVQAPCCDVLLRRSVEIDDMRSGDRRIAAAEDEDLLLLCRR
jgi:hypothetical protein